MSVVRIAAIALVALALAACAAAPTRTVGEGAPAVRYTPEPTATVASTPLPSASALPAPDFDGPPAAANDAATLALQLAMVERAIRDPNVSGARLKWYGHLEQLIFGRLADFPEWREPVIAALPAAVQEPVRNSLEAGRQLRSMHGAPAKELPEWHIAAPPAPDELLRAYKDAEETFGVPWYYLASINLIETRMGRIRGDSVAGAQGPMQFIPSTWAMYGKGDVNDPHDAIMAAARYLKAAGAPGDMPRAIFAYNHATAYVNAVTAYAEAMRLDPNAFRGYYGWQVYIGMETGPVLLPEGWAHR